MTAANRTARLAVDHDLEAALVAAILDRGDLLHHAQHLHPAALHWPTYAHIWHAALELARHDRTIHPHAITEQLRTDGLLDTIHHHQGRPEGPALIHQLTLPTPPGPHHLRDWADTLNRLHLQRTLQTHIHTAQQAAHDGRLDDLATALTDSQTALAEHAPHQIIGWEALDAAIRGDDPPLAPTILTRTDGRALIYPGLTHWLAGEPGRGKTFLALHAAVQEINAGHTVIWLDWEGNRRIIGERLRALGAHPEHAPLVKYWRPPTLTQTHITALRTTIRETNATLAVYDGVAKALARQGLSEDKAPDVLAWLELAVNPIADTGIACLLLDHVVKNRDTRGAWARGSGAKLGEVTGAAWTVRTGDRDGFSRTKAGHVRLVQAKDREGWNGADGDTIAIAHFTPAHDGRLTIRLDPPADTPRGEWAGPTFLMERISRHLEAHGESTKNAVISTVQGKRTALLAGIDKLVELGHVTVTRGPRQSQVLRVTTPYRDPTSATHSDPKELPSWHDEDF